MKKKYPIFSFVKNTLVKGTNWRSAPISANVTRFRGPAPKCKTEVQNKCFRASAKIILPVHFTINSGKSQEKYSAFPKKIYFKEN